MEMGRGKERVRYMERVTRKLTLPCKIDSQREFAIWLRKLKRALYPHRGLLQMGRQTGGSFERKGIYVYLKLIHVEV